MELEHQVKVMLEEILYVHLLIHIQLLVVEVLEQQVLQIQEVIQVMAV